jgi:hypothetical protein
MAEALTPVEGMIAVRVGAGILSSQVGIALRLLSVPTIQLEAVEVIAIERVPPEKLVSLLHWRVIVIEAPVKPEPWRFPVSWVSPTTPVSETSENPAVARLNATLGGEYA